MPQEAHTTPTAIHQTFVDVVPADQLSSSTRPGGRKSTSRSLGPPRGFFQVDKHKPWGILDPSGKKIIYMPAPETDRHDWLRPQLQRAYSNSASTSPATSFAQLLDESDSSVMSSQEARESQQAADREEALNDILDDTKADPTLVAELLNDMTAVPTRFDASGIDAAQALAFDNFSDISNEADIPGNVMDLIQFDDEEDDDDLVTSPIYAPPRFGLGDRSPDEEFPHLNNLNVTAFRHHADPSRAAVSRELEILYRMSDFSSPVPDIPTLGKRKAAPYQDSMYEGVTPVQRQIVKTAKRRKISM